MLARIYWKIVASKRHILSDVTGLLRRRETKSHMGSKGTIYVALHRLDNRLTNAHAPANETPAIPLMRRVA